MPGIVGLVSKTDAMDDLRKCQSTLIHFDWLTSRAFSPAEKVGLGVVYRKDRRDDFEYFEDAASQTCVLLSGFVFQASSGPRRLAAADLFSRYIARGFSEWDQLDGSFVCAIYDGRASKLHLITDRLGSLPLYYALGPGTFAFAPEAKGILAHPEFSPSFDRKGVTQFLTTGYCLGSQTLFEGISVMLPATVLTIDTVSLNNQTQRYWNLKYERRREFTSDSDAQEALYQALVDAHELNICDEPERVAIMLSGGWDSRAMLAFMEKAGRPFNSALTWGYRDDIPFSDASIARELAARFKTTFEFTAYTTDTLVENAESWCYISELANDNLGWYAEGTGVLTNSYDKTVDCLFVGDEIWGWGNAVTDEEEMRAEILPPHLPETVRAILSDNCLAQAVESYESALEEIMRYCDNDDPNDRKDYLYLHGRVARFIFSVGYYKELAMPIRRPFLSRGVVDVMTGLSPSQRVYKRLYRSMLRRFAPKVAEVPIATVNSLPDWEFDLRNDAKLRDYLLDLLDPRRLSAGPLGDILNLDAVVELRQREFSRSVRPMRRKPNRARDLLGSAIRSGSLGYLLKRKLRPKIAAHHAATGFAVIQRVALLSLLERMFPKFDRPSERD